jgi:hypothetical protein
VLLVGLAIPVGCDRGPGAAAAPSVPSTGQTEFCDFRGGPPEALVKVVAYYPGGHEDTLAAVKRLIGKHKGLVSVEIVDWRHKAGAARRERAGLSCAGITINGKNAFDLHLDGRQEKVLFVRGLDGEWTEALLTAAVEAEIAAARAVAP